MTNDYALVKDRLEKVVRREVDDKTIPSISYALVDGNQTVCTGHIRARGTAEIDAVSNETMFRVGSCSKMFTTIAMMQLAENGQVDIDVDISTYIPGFHPENPFIDPKVGTTKEDAITLRKLMSHTAGMVREPTVGHYFDDRAPSLAAMVDSVSSSTLVEDPKAKVFKYSNTGIAVVGRALELITGRGFNAYVQENVLDPIGMANSSFTRTAELEAYLASAKMWNVEGDFPAPLFDMGGPPAGNLFATVPDMAEFLKVLLRGGYTIDGKPILKTETLHSMWESQSSTGRPGFGYGLGFGVGTLDGWKTIGHNGAVYGFSTQCTAVPEAQLGIVMCSTLDGTNAILSRVSQYALRLMLAAKGMGKQPPDPVMLQPLTEKQLIAFTGFYRKADTRETVEVKSRDGKLYIIDGRMPLRIQPLSEYQLFVNGRVFGPGSEYPYLEVSFAPPGTGERVSPSLAWQGVWWNRVPEPTPEQAPEELQPYIGEYGPDFNITYIFYQGGALRCLIEWFFTHSLEKVSETVYRMHGLLYEDETLVFGVRNADGDSGIKVGPVFLKRRG